MNAQRKWKVGVALVAASAIVSSLITGGAFPVAATASASTFTEIDYFDDAYANLGANSVYESVTFERFEWLLKQSGTFAFLIGGPNDTNTNATIGHINDVAKSYGVQTVFNFNPLLDGNAVDVRNYQLKALESAATKTQVDALYTRILSSYLNKDTSTVFTRSSTTDPYLFIYNKDHTSGGVEDRIVASLDVRHVEADFGVAGVLDTYKQQVGAVFDAVSTINVGTGLPVAQLTESTQFDYIKTEVDRKHKSDYPDATRYGGDPLSESDRAGWRVQQITYPELIDVLNTPGDHVILFGGNWCHNTRAVIQDINAQAKAKNVPVVYFFDLRLDGATDNNLHIRSSSSSLSYLYGDLVRTYFPNLVTQYVVTTSNRVDYYPGGDRTQPVQSAKKLQVPYLIQYNKDNIVGGSAAPVKRNWIRENGAGSYTEYMTELWFKYGLRGSSSSTTIASWVTGKAFYDDAIVKLTAFFENLAVDRDTITTSLTTAAVAAADSVQLTATVGNVADASIATPATGSVEFFEVAAPDVSLGTAAVTGGIATLGFAGVPLGEHRYYSVYTPALGILVTASTSPATSVTIVPAVVPTALQFAAAASADTVTLSAAVTAEGFTATGAHGSVEFFEAGSPATSLGTVSVVDGLAATSLSTVAVGTHSYYAVFTPESGSTYTGSTSATEAATVAEPVPAVATALGLTASLSGSAVTLSTSLTYAGAPETAPAGSVEFFLDGSPDVSVGTAPLVGTSATLGLTAVAVGGHSYYAVFTPGDPALFVASTSGLASVNVLPERMATSVATNAVVSANSAVITATIANGAVTALDALGYLEFFAVGAPAVSLGTVAVVNGGGSVTLSALSAGEHLYYAVYSPSGATLYSGSTSDIAAFVIPTPTVAPPAAAALKISPTVLGKPEVGAVLSVALNANYRDALGKQFQWLRDGLAIAGATADTYTPDVTDRGSQISVQVGASRTGRSYVAEGTSPKTDEIGLGRIRLSTETGARTEPSASGIRGVGKKLTALLPDYVTTELTLSYRWLRDGVSIESATGATYVLTDADTNTEISLLITASKDGYRDLALLGVVPEAVSSDAVQVRPFKRSDAPKGPAAP